jgi:hypothetical protein
MTDNDQARPTQATAAAWLRHTFAGLTAGRAAIVVSLMVLFALSRPPVMAAVVGGRGLAAIAGAAVAPLVFTFLRYTPMLLLVVAAANHGPRDGVRRMVWIGGALLAGIAIGTVLMAFAVPALSPQSVLARQIDLTAPGWLQAVHWAGVSLGDVAIAAVVTGFWYYFKRNAEAAVAVQQAQDARERMERENAEARVALMQAQIEPHFLFNTLASIRRLYETDAAAGRTMLRHLSRYLAASLPALRAARSTLGRELALATAYLNVQKIRMGHRLAMEVDVPAHLHELEVPPMMLATLVENSIIHGIGPLPEGGVISIRAYAEAQQLCIEVADTGRGLRDAWGPGVGLANIGARLHSQFGEQACVTLANANDRGVVAKIELPLRTADEALAA